MFLFTGATDGGFAGPAGGGTDPPAVGAGMLPGVLAEPGGFAMGGVDIIMVPRNFLAPAPFLSSCPQAAQFEASSVFGFPQFEQKTVTLVPPAVAVTVPVNVRGEKLFSVDF